MILARFTQQLLVRLHIAFILLACNTAAKSNVSPKRKPKESRRELSTYFNMRLFWRQGYRWQENSSEKKWCMTCKSNRCPKGSGIKITRCNTSDWRQHFFYDDGRIRSRRNKEVCLERQGRRIVLNNCRRSINQTWDTLKKGEPFQLRIPGDDEKCASQHHHPKDGEKVYMTSCKKSLIAQSDKWVAY